MKEELLQQLENPKDLLIAVDLDMTLCTGKFWEEECAPIPEMIAKVWDWYIKGAHIVIYTARQPKYFSQTQAWLMRHEVPFHGIVMQMKPGADIYVDDKAVNPEDL